MKTSKRRVTGRAASRAAGKRAKHRRVKAEKERAAKATPAPAPVLSSSQRKQVRALAHALEPIVLVGHAGVSGGVVAATRQALLDHELIKVRLHEPEDKAAMASELAERTQAALCGLIGHTAILYKPHPKRPKVSLRANRSKPP